VQDFQVVGVRRLRLIAPGAIASDHPEISATGA
jgi:hypothetical protein